MCSDPNYTPPLLLDDVSKRLDVDSAILPRQDSNTSFTGFTEEIPKCGSTLGILTLQKKQKVSNELLDKLKHNISILKKCLKML